MTDRHADDALLQAWRAGDDHAFTLLVERHAPLVRGVCARVLGPGADADDAAQATFIALARKAAGLRGDRVAAWLHHVARCCARDVLRSRDARRRREHAAAPSSREPPGDLGLDEALAALPERHRLALLLACGEGLPLAVVAKRMGTTEGTAASWVHRGRERLRAALSRRGRQVAPAGIAVLLAPPPASGAVSLVPALVPAHVHAIAIGALRMILLARLALAAGMLVASALAVGAVAIATAERPAPNGQPAAPDAVDEVRAILRSIQRGRPIRGRSSSPSGRD